MRFKQFFESQNYEDFINHARKLGVSPEELINSILQKGPEYSGGNNHFRRIPDSNYGIRYPKRGNLVVNGIQSQMDPFPEDNFGQPIASTKDGVQVVKLQSGNPAGHPYTYDKTTVDGVKKARDEFRERLKEASDMPVESYVNVLRQIQKLNSKGYVVDPSKSSNLLIDVKNKSFNIVDVNQSNSGYKNSADDLIIMLIHNFKASMVLGKDSESQYWMRQIIKKTEYAAKQTGMNIDQTSSSLDFSYKLAGLRPSFANSDWQPYDYDDVNLEDLVQKPRNPRNFNWNYV